MVVVSISKLVAFLAIALSINVSVVAADVIGEDSGPFASLREQYAALSPKGQFVTGACVGFVGTRIALTSAMGAVKIAGAVFVTAEVLHYTGILDDLPPFSNEQTALFSNLKNKALRHTENLRVQIRRQLNPNSVQTFVDRERMGALGMAGGAVVGFLF